MKMKIHICDICGRNIFDPFIKGAVIKNPAPMKIKIKRYNNPFEDEIKIKRYNNSFGDNIFPWSKVEICTYCAENIYKYCKEHCK